MLRIGAFGLALLSTASPLFAQTPFDALVAPRFEPDWTSRKLDAPQFKLGSAADLLYRIRRDGRATESAWSRLDWAALAMPLGSGTLDVGLSKGMTTGFAGGAVGGGFRLDDQTFELAYSLRLGRGEARLSWHDDDHAFSLASGLFGSSLPVLGDNPDLLLSMRRREARLQWRFPVGRWTLEAGGGAGQADGEVQAVRRNGSGQLDAPALGATRSWAVAAGRSDWQVRAEGLRSSGGGSPSLLGGWPESLSEGSFETSSVAARWRRRYANGRQLVWSVGQGRADLDLRAWFRNGQDLGLGVPRGTQVQFRGSAQLRTQEVGIEANLSDKWQIGYRHLFGDFTGRAAYDALYFAYGVTTEDETTLRGFSIGVLDASYRSKLMGVPLKVSFRQALPFRTGAPSTGPGTGPKSRAEGGWRLSVEATFAFR